MTLQQLRYVVTVAVTGTITEAANKLYITQPSLTNAIHDLEKEMNIVIFNRTNKGITLSREGEDFLDMPDRFWIRRRSLRTSTRGITAARSSSACPHSTIHLQ